MKILSMPLRRTTFGEITVGTRFAVNKAELQLFYIKVSEFRAERANKYNVVIDVAGYRENNYVVWIYYPDNMAVYILD
jgi:hypothetical protein